MAINKNKNKILNLIVASSCLILLKHLKKGKKNRKYHVNPYLRERNKKGRFATDVSPDIF